MASNAVDQLPGSQVPYRLEAGGGRRFLAKGAVTRVLASGLETGGEIAVTGLQSPADDGRITPHFHEPRVHPADCRPEPVALAQHDFTYVLRGRVQVWADGESRILGPGDIVSIPPGTRHSSQMLSHGTELLAPCFPAGFTRFIEAMGSPYYGPAYPPVDDSAPPPPGTFEQMVAEKLLTPVRDFVYVEPTLDAADDQLPDDRRPYFLRAGNGPRHELFGQVCFQALTGAQSNGAMALTITEGPTGASFPAHVHAETYEGLFCVEGRMTVRVGGEEHELIGGDFISIPQGVEHSYVLRANFTRFVSMIAPAGIEHLFEVAGRVADQKIFPSIATTVDPDKLAAAAAELDVKFI